MEEIWKIYKESTCVRLGHRVYEVSNLGRVRINGEVVQPHINQKYYWIGGFYVHRAVAELFISNNGNKPQVDHINGNCLDNSVTNLHWVTIKENRNNPITAQRIKEANTGVKRSRTTKDKISRAFKGARWEVVDGKRKLMKNNKDIDE